VVDRAPAAAVRGAKPSTPAPKPRNATARRNGVKRAVMLSSISAQVPTGVGPISSLHQVEREFQAGFADLVILRPTFFMENHFASIASIATMGAIFAPIARNVRFPQIAAREHRRAGSSTAGRRHLDRAAHPGAAWTRGSELRADRTDHR